MAAPQASSRLEMLQARFQQKQLQEKEQKLLQLYDQQQQRAYQVVQRGSAGSNQGSSSVRTMTTTTTTSTMTTTAAAHTTSTSQGGKVRQMFDERRQTTVKGIDRSYPLEPLENKLRKQTNNGVQATQRNGNLAMNRQSVSMKRMARADVNSNVNGGKPAVSYHEEITRESFGPFVRRHDDDDESGIENRVAAFANGHYRRDADNEQDEGLDQESIERNRMMAKIHLMGYDDTLKHRVRNDLESEEFPEHLMMDVPDKLPKKNVTKKLSQAEARLERFKNTVAKRSNVPKQSISTGTVIKKRSEPMEPARSSFQGNEVAGTWSATRSGSRTSERSQRILAKNPLATETRGMSKRQKKSSEVETISRRGSSDISTRKVTKARAYSRNNEFKSLTSDGKIFIRRSPNPRSPFTESERSSATECADSRSASPDRTKRNASTRFFHRENERSAATTSIDRKTNGSKSSDSEVHGKRSTGPRYFDVGSRRQRPTTASLAAKVGGAESPEWYVTSSSKESASPRFFSRESGRSTDMSIDESAATSESPDRDERTFKTKSGATPRYSSKQYEGLSETSIDRKSNLSESPLFYRDTSTKRGAAVDRRFFLNEFEQIDQTPRADRPNSSVWIKEISQRDTISPPYSRVEFKQTGKSIDADRKTSECGSLKGNKSMSAKQTTQYFDEKHRASTILGRKTTTPGSLPREEDVLKRRGASPQFFREESERSGTTVTIDRTGSDSRSPSHDRKRVTRQSSSPQFFCEESERSATTVSIDRKIKEPKFLSDNRKVSTRESKGPQYFNRDSGQRARTTGREYDESKPSGSTRDKRTTNPRFFCGETEKSATTMISIEPRLSATDPAAGGSQHRDYTSDATCEQSVKQSLPSVNEKMSSARSRRISDPLITKHEVKGRFKKDGISVTETRRSSKASESSTSASSIVNLKYGLEFDKIFQSAQLVRKFMKSQKGEHHPVRQSAAKRNVKKAATAKDVQPRNRHGTLLFSQKTRSPSKAETEDEKGTTPESPRKSITPTEVDMEIQEITMTDHRIERNGSQNTVASPISKPRIDGTFARSSGNKTKFKTSCPVRKTSRQRTSILGSSVFGEKSPFDRSRGIKDHRSDRDSEASAISLSKLDDCTPVNETSRHAITRAKEDRVRKSDAKMFRKTRKQIWNRSINNRTGYTEVGSVKKHEDQQRASSRSPDQNMRHRSAEDKLRRSETMPSDSYRGEQHSADTSILCEKRSKATRAEFDRSRRLQSTRLVRDALKSENLPPSEIDKRSRREDKHENKTVDETGSGIDAKYQTIVETALNKKMKDGRKSVGPNPAGDIRSKDAPPREEARASTKLIIPRKIISPRGECGRQHDAKSSTSSRASPARQASKISQILVCQKVVSKADRSSSPKFLTYTIKNRKQKGIPGATREMESRHKMNIKHGTESNDTAKEIRKLPLTRQEDKSKNDFERMDSVESALKRFDSIGAEFEYSGPASFRASPEISLQMMNAQTEISAKGPIIISQESMDPHGVTEDKIFKSSSKCAIDKESESQVKDPKIKNVARKSESWKILGREIYASKGLAKPKGSTRGKRRSTQTRSPTCKRQLFRSDAEKQITEGRLKANRAKARKKENRSATNVTLSRENGASSPKARSSGSLDREITKESKCSESSGFSVKPLRSIEDIRKSFDDERNKLIAVKESRSAIANRHSALREGIDAKRSIFATDAARNVFLGGDPARLTKVKSCVSRITKSPSPDIAARRQHETNATRTTRGSILSSPSKSSDIASRNQETKSSRKSVVARGDSIGNKVAATTTVDVADGVVLQNGSLHESPTKKSDAFVIDLNDQPSKESDTVLSKKPSVRKPSSDQTTFRSGRSISSSSFSANSSQNQAPSTKARMAAKTSFSSGPQTKKVLPAKSSNSIDTNLVACNICKRNFAQDRISYHEVICAKTANKKRKQFNTKIFRTRGTELESFMKEDKKQELKPKKSDVKSDWRRKHEDFINTIRYAKQVQAHVAAGGNPNDISPPPPSDTSDYIQCPHCGRKFNQTAAERHIPKCENMRHNKPGPQSRAPPRPRR